MEKLLDLTKKSLLAHLSLIIETKEDIFVKLNTMKEQLNTNWDTMLQCSYVIMMALIMMVVCTEREYTHRDITRVDHQKVEFPRGSE